jgi:hypothetical protein
MVPGDRKYSVYLLYWYKSTNTDAAEYRPPLLSILLLLACSPCFFLFRWLGGQSRLVLLYALKNKYFSITSLSTLVTLIMLTCHVCSAVVAEDGESCLVAGGLYWHCSRCGSVAAERARADGCAGDGRGGGDSWGGARDLSLLVDLVAKFSAALELFVVGGLALNNGVLHCLDSSLIHAVMGMRTHI